MNIPLRGGVAAVAGLGFLLSAGTVFAGGDGLVNVFVPQITAATVSAAPASGACNLEGGPVTLVIRDSSLHTVSPAVAPICTGGAWSTTVDATSLDEGALLVDVSQTNGSSRTDFPASKDTVLPTISFVYFGGTIDVIPGGYVYPAASSTPSFDFESPDNDFDSATCQIDSGAVEDCSSWSYVSPIVLANGSHTLHIIPMDSVHNVGVSNDTSFCIDACGGGDVTPPVITTPATTTAAAASASGTVLTFSATANDATDGAVSTSCVPASGSLFALGTTTVTCTAHDVAFNWATSTFDVIVTDTTAPSIVTGTDIFATSTSSSGAVVSFTDPTATDDVDVSVSVSCTPSSGSTFPVGTTTVTCTATDAALNSATSTFIVTVTGDTVSASPVTGSYTGAQSVTLTQTGATEIRYTTDGSTPTCATGALYSSPIALSASATIHAVACYGAIPSLDAAFAYDISIPAPAPLPSGGSNGPPVAPTPSPTSGGTSPAAPSFGTGASPENAPGTANGTPIAPTVISQPIRSASAVSTPSPLRTTAVVESAENSVPVVAQGDVVPESSDSRIVTAPESQVAGGASGLPGGNYLWIFLVFLLLLLGGWFVWNNFWTRPE
ncbi:HYR domain-containing protein [Candidatus Kaiserbacteria bacterium]|nr:HYR domain-containing protein [Candidatus Kaiserbacteria bacterium]